MTIPLHAGVVYGPVQSRCLGRSLGINVLPAGEKICNFNCPYCEYGWTDPRSLCDPAWAPAEMIATAVADALTGSHYPALDRLTLAGNGEPTLHPMFPEIVDCLVDVRQRYAPGSRLAVLSNASTLTSPSVVAALGRLDERYMKLDAGDVATLRRINAAPVSVDRLVNGLARLNGVVLQSMFVRDPAGRVDNTTEYAVERWLDAVAHIRPLAVHIFTVDRTPAWQALQKVPPSELGAIARLVESLDVPAVVF